MDANECDVHQGRLNGSAGDTKGYGMTNCHEFELAGDENRLEVAECLKNYKGSTSEVHEFVAQIASDLCKPSEELAHRIFLANSASENPPGIYSQTYCTCDH